MNESIATIKRNRYLQALYQFGVFTLCYMITQYEQEEKYEECEIILSAIKEHQATIKEEMPTRFDKETKDYLLGVMEVFNLKPETTLNNLPHYAMETRIMVNKDLKQ